MKDLTHGPAPGFWKMLWRTNGLLVVIVVVATVAFGINGFIDLRLGQAFDARGVETTAKFWRAKSGGSASRTARNAAITLSFPMTRPVD